MSFNPSQAYSEREAVSAYATLSIPKKKSIYPETFLWGIISSQDESGEKEASFYTNNTASLYKLSNETYVLDIDTFSTENLTAEEKINFINDVLNGFTDYMKANDYNIEEDLDWATSGCMLTMQSQRIEQVYAQYKIFAKGFAL